MKALVIFSLLIASVFAQVTDCTGKSVGTSCTTGNVCITGAVCNGMGTCIGGSAISCAYLNTSTTPCVTTACDPLQGCILQAYPANTACTINGNRCNLARCNSNGICVNTMVVIMCPTGQVCDPATGTCGIIPSASPTPMPTSSGTATQTPMPTAAATQPPTPSLPPFVITTSTTDGSTTIGTTTSDMGTATTTTGKVKPPKQTTGSGSSSASTGQITTGSLITVVVGTVGTVLILCSCLGCVGLLFGANTRFVRVHFPFIARHVGSDDVQYSRTDDEYDSERPALVPLTTYSSGTSSSYEVFDPRQRSDSDAQPHSFH
jgi:hypothetical protein